MSSPAGTVTFLFSDIEGSTQRWEANHAAMDAAVKQHDALMRAAIEQRGGYVFKTVGDAFCAAFHTATEAVAAAVDIQSALIKEDFSAVGGLRVRMGVHVGEASERDGDYFGSTVNRVARLMSIGHGGQVLISSAVQELIENDLPSGVSLVDLGSRRLKDLAQPEQVWQLIISGLPPEFPPLNSLDARPNNLPVQVSSLIGRERDLQDVRSLISAHRLVTVSGSGGVGKTRVALQVGADLIDRFDHGVWFADLAPLRDLELVASVVGKALGISVPEGQRLDEAIPQAIFAGSFSLDAASTVCGGDVIDAAEVLDLLSSLADKSLVVADTSGEQERYRLLESTRAYALEKLTTAGEREHLARRQAEYFRDQAEAADPRYGTGSTTAWLADACLETSAEHESRRGRDCAGHGRPKPNWASHGRSSI